MRKLLFVAVSLCSLVLFAVDPVAVWNGDFTTTTKGDYTLNANDNTVAADGSSITISTAKGVTFERSSALANNVGMTAIYKFDNLVIGSTVKTIGTASVGGGNADRIGVNVQTTGQTSGIWANTSTYNTSATQATVSSVESDGQFALVYGPAVANNTGTYLYLKNGSEDYTQVYSCGGLKSHNDTVQAMTVGGTRNNGGTFPAASGMVIKSVALFDQALTQAQIAEYVFPKPTKKVEPLMLINFGYTEEEAGWYNYTQNQGSTIPQSGTLVTNGVAFSATKDIGNFFSTVNDAFAEVNTDWVEGSYENVFGTSFTTVAEELASSLGIDGLRFSSNVYKSGLMNGGQTDHQVTITGLDRSSKYVIYAGFGILRTQYNEQVMGVQFDTSGYASVDALEYIVTIEGTGTIQANRYQTFTAGTTLCPGPNGLLLTRLKNVQPKADGSVSFIFKGAKGGINFLAVAKVNEAKPTTTTIDISGPTNYGDLETAGFTGVTLNLTANAELTFAEAVPDNVALTFTGAYDLTVKGAQHLTFAKVNDAAVSGKVSYEISGSYNAGAGLINKIKDAGTNRTFIFAGSGNAGTTLRISTDNNTYLNKTLATHLVFDGGTHTLEIRSENAGLKFGRSATVENPTVYVKGNAVLTFHARNLCGWTAGAADKTGVIRIDDGSSVNLVPTEGTLYWTQMIYLQSGATLNFTDNNANDPKLRIAGGTSEANAQIVVPETTAGNAKKAIIKQLGSAPIWAKSEGTGGFVISVGANAVLEFDAALNGPSAVSKYGAGTLVMKRAVSAPMTVAAGMIGGSASVEELSLRDAAGLAVDSSAALTVTGTLLMPNPVTIAGVLEKNMAVVMVPADYEATGATATNGSRTYELTRSGNELLLVYLIPPSRGEGTDLTVTPSAVDGVSDSVSIVVPGLNEGDYAGMVTYMLDFGGEKTVSGTYADGAIVFAFPDELKVGGQVLRGELTATFDTDQALALGPVTVYQGRRQFVWTPEGELWVDETQTTKGATGTWTDGIDVANGKLVVNAASGVTFTPTANPDYIETCDSTFTVSISAAEAVDAASDPAPEADVQGGVRIASVNGVLKVQVLANGAWTDLKASGVEPGTDYAVEVAFHYAKPGVEDDRDTVSYTLDGVTVTGEKVRDTVAKISTVAVADGTQLAFLKGVCQLDKAVVVDVTVEIEHDENKPIDAKDLAAAQAVADKMVVAISDEVAKVVDATTYRGYFKVVAKQGEDGQFHATVAFAPGVQEDIENDLQEAMEKVVAGIETGRAEIAAKPGLYYGLKRGDKLGNLSILDKLTLAGADGKVTIEITKPEGATKHFYRIVCLPTPAEPAK